MYKFSAFWRYPPESQGTEIRENPEEALLSAGVNIGATALPYVNGFLWSSNAMIMSTVTAVSLQDSHRVIYTCDICEWVCLPA